MKDPARTVHDLLLRKRLTVAAAESCTGGLLSSLLTSLSGSSSYYISGVVTYSNRSKQAFLDVPAGMIKRFGAVSKPVCLAMAKGIRRRSRTDLGIAITGIAGPTGASPGKPVGTVFIAVAGPQGSVCRRFLFKGSRSQVRKSAALTALKMLGEIVVRLPGRAPSGTLVLTRRVKTSLESSSSLSPIT